MSKETDNLWILFEERPKTNIIKSILKIFIDDHNLNYKDEGLSILPIFKNKIFGFSYKIENFKIEKIENIYLKLLYSLMFC